MFVDIYIKPWARVGPYLVGILLALILHKKCQVKNVSICQHVLHYNVISLCSRNKFENEKSNMLLDLRSNVWLVASTWTFDLICRRCLGIRFPYDLRRFCVLSPLVLDAGTVLESIPPLSCAGFVYCHCTGRWAVLDNTHSKDSCAFR